MKRSLVPSVVIDPVRESLISSSGALVLRETIRTCGLDRRLAEALSPWRPPRARHDPSKVVLDIATALALGGDCLSDIAAIRSQPTLFGPVASDPTVSRLLTKLWAKFDIWKQMDHVEMDLMLKQRLRFIPELSKNSRAWILIALDTMEIVFLFFPLVFGKLVQNPNSLFCISSGKIKVGFSARIC